MVKKICPQHNLELNLIPEGVSKKNSKQYKAFYACPNRDCKFTESINDEKKSRFLSIQAEFRRSKEIAYFNSLNAAVEMTKNLPSNKKVELVEIVKNWRDLFYEEWQEWYEQNIINEE